MHHPLTDIQANFEIDRPVRDQITAKNLKCPQTTDGQTDRRTNGQTSRTTTIFSIFEKEKTTKNNSSDGKYTNSNKTI